MHASVAITFPLQGSHLGKPQTGSLFGLGQREGDGFELFELRDKFERMLVFAQEIVRDGCAVRNYQIIRPDGSVSPTRITYKDGQSYRFEPDSFHGVVCDSGPRCLSFTPQQALDEGPSSRPAYDRVARTLYEIAAGVEREADYNLGAARPQSLEPNPAAEFNFIRKLSDAGVLREEVGCAVSGCVVRGLNDVFPRVSVITGTEDFSKKTKDNLYFGILDARIKKPGQGTVKRTFAYLELVFGTNQWSDAFAKRDISSKHLKEGAEYLRILGKSIGLGEGICGHPDNLPVLREHYREASMAEKKHFLGGGVGTGDLASQ